MGVIFLPDTYSFIRYLISHLNPELSIINKAEKVVGIDQAGNPCKNMTAASS
jgi:hypothetical protein